MSSVRPEGTVLADTLELWEEAIRHREIARQFCENRRQRREATAELEAQIKSQTRERIARSRDLLARTADMVNRRPGAR